MHSITQPKRKTSASGVRYSATKSKILLASAALLSVCSMVSGAPNTNMIDYNKYEMDAPITDMMWCGTSNEVILVLTNVGTVYRSRDRGQAWKKLQGIMATAGNEVKDNDQEVS